MCVSVSVAGEDEARDFSIVLISLQLLDAGSKENFPNISFIACGMTWTDKGGLKFIASTVYLLAEAPIFFSRSGCLDHQLLNREGRVSFVETVSAFADGDSEDEDGSFLP